jgi:hypothetical protein
VRAFCRAEGVNEPQFYWWRRHLGRGEPKTPAFVPVHVLTGPAGEPATRGAEVVPADGRCLRAAPGFVPRTPVALVELLEARGPSCRACPRPSASSSRRGRPTSGSRRKSFDPLADVVREGLRGDPVSGNILVFRNKAADRIKLPTPRWFAFKGNVVDLAVGAIVGGTSHGLIDSPSRT